jgi:hypothetical protein
MSDELAGGAPLQRVVRALDPERDAFEAWWCKAYHPAKLERKEAGCYLELSAGMAWAAWQAARPKRAAVGAIVNVAAELAQRKPLDPFDNMTEATHIGHRQFDRVYRQADEKVRLLAIKLANAVRAL